MPKGRGSKNRQKTQRITKRMIAERTKGILEAQRQRFRDKFGRDWREGDPVFFDPDASEPSPMSEFKLQAEVLEAMRKAGTPPQIAYAYKKTGLLLTEEMRDHWPPDRVQEWDAATEEFFAIEAATARGDKPDAQQWTTEIPELLASPFTQQDFDQVQECLRAIEPIEARGMKVVTRIELAASLLAHACSHGYTSGEETGEGGDGPNLFALTEQLVIRRAREIYGQGQP